MDDDMNSSWYSYNDFDEETDVENYGDSDSESDSEYDNYDTMYFEDQTFIEVEKQNNRYYIGICKLVPANYYLLVNSMSSQMFFKYPYQLSLQYLMIYSIISVYNPKIEIMKLQSGDTYRVLIKTHWIRLIQRHWRTVMKQRTEMYKQRFRITSLRHFETHGRYPSGLNSLPCLYGMLSCYAKKQKIRRMD